MKTTTPAILMVDDEPNVLSAYRRTVGRSFNLTVADSGRAALAMLNPDQPFAVIISDMRMPEMNGLEFILAARQKSRDSVFMMLTGNADQETAVAAINRGQIFRFLNKPCPPESLDTALNAALRQHELITAERVLLRETVAGSIKLLVDALEIASPKAFGCQSLVKRIQQELGAELGAVPDWQLNMASSLCLIGLVAMPSPAVLSDEILNTSAEIGGKLLAHIPRLQTIAKMVRNQRTPGMLPDDLTVHDAKIQEAIGTQILRFSVDLARLEWIGTARATALGKLSETRKYDNRLIQCLVKPADNIPSVAASIRPVDFDRIRIDQLQPGMVLHSDLILPNGRLLLARGQSISELAATGLQNCFKSNSGMAMIEIVRQKIAA